MKNAGSNILKSIPVLLLLLAAFYGSSTEDEGKTPEELQNILENFMEDVGYNYDIRVDYFTGDVSLYQLDRNEDGSRNNELLTTYTLSDFDQNALMEAFIFWIDISNNQVKLNYIDPSNNQTYSYEIDKLANLNLEVTGSYSAYPDFNGANIEGFRIVTRENGTNNTIETYYIDLNSMELRNYFNYGDIVDEFHSIYGEQAFTLFPMLRENGIVYLNGYAPQVGANPLSVALIIDTYTGEYRFLENIEIMGSASIDGHEVMSYTFLREDGGKNFGVRDLTTNKDLLIKDYIPGSGVNNFMSLEEFGMYWIESSPTGIIYPIFSVDGELRMEQWNLPDNLLITIYSDPQENLLGLFLNGPSSILGEAVRKEIINPFTGVESSQEQWDTLFEMTVELLNEEGLGGELTRETYEIIYDSERLLEEPR